ncbi:MAG: SURF1 family cytochrome oxidase biogenesis protein [Pseudomonadota bacterium]
MMRHIPLIPTTIVILAAAAMVGLGFWQIGRADEKAALIASYETATGSADPVAFPLEGEGEEVWFRQSALTCENAIAIEPVAGRAANGAKGWAMRAKCAVIGVDGAGAEALVDLGFARALEVPDWNGGEVTGVIAPGPRLIAAPAVGGLMPLAKPDPKDLPNNHIAYAGQWFFFAITALVIYAFALKARAARRREPPSA